MKKLLSWLVVLTLSVCLIGVFSLIGCKEEVAPAEEEVAEEVSEEAEEEVAPAEEVELTKDELYDKLYGDLNGTELNFLGWQGYDGGEFIKPFLEKYNITLNPLYVANNEEIFTKLKVGGGGRYDIVSPYHGHVPSFIENDLLEPLDLNLIPNYEDVFDVFKNFDWNKSDGNVYSIPFTWGATTILYNADEVEEPDSWYDLLDPKYEGKIITLDNPGGNIWLAAIALGYETPTLLTEEELEKCYDWLLKAKKNWRYIAPSYGDVLNSLVSGEAWICFSGWDAVASWAQAEGANIKSTIPKEGTFSFIDNFGIAKDAKNKMTSYAFINELLDPEVHASFIAWLSSAAVNRESIQYMDELVANAFPYDDIQGFFKKAIPYPPTPTESDEYTTMEDHNLMWEKLKAAE